ncbi:PIG-L family deacetylase [Cyclobacterium plantarum]|uniref:PIG-L family deacetylase n=1 Tax=Cyclobacterium plantarum TaxID=2716263 RepID=A0ABX0HA07_9BACT|nr:PIG-L family deacetylase [Cyclobacterium plantarum]NHE58210.1 PIG-L family deacetylase [Cyclobacterium plantarum]
MKKKRFLIIFGIFFVLFLSLFYLLKTKRSEIFDYDISENYHYKFNTRNTTKLNLIENKLLIPDNLGKGTTAFIKVNIKSTFLGKIFSPNIELISKSAKVIDYFEFGGSGDRYLNISSLLQEEAKQIELKSNFLEIQNATVELIHFSKSIPTESKILIISPHPDDAEIAAFGLYSKFPNSFILTITAGENGLMHYNEIFPDSIQHYLKKGQIRTINSISIPLMAGLKHDHILNLGYFDGTLKEMFDRDPHPVFSQILKTDSIGIFRNLNFSSLKDSLTGRSNWSSLVQNIQLVLDFFQPDIIVSPHPQMDSHPDHQFSTLATIEAIRNAGLNKGELFLYSNHHVKTEFFPFGKTGGTLSLPPNYDDDYHFHSVYSHALSEEDQMEKVLALDAMNDLRPNTQWRYWHKLLHWTYQNIKVSIKGQQNTYFRRAIRSNELFFVVPIQELNDETPFEKTLTPNRVILE